MCYPDSYRFGGMAEWLNAAVLKTVVPQEMALVAREVVKKIEDELEYPGQIKVNIIRENRTVDYAK